MRFECNETEVKHFFIQDVIVRHKIDEKCKHRIHATAGCIMIGLQGHEPPEQRIKNIQDLKNELPYFMVDPSHESCENNS